MRKEKDSIERDLQGYTLVTRAILLAIETVAISVADKVHNKASLLVAYQEQGASVFSRFNKDFPTTLDNDLRVMEVYKRKGWEKITL